MVGLSDHWSSLVTKPFITVPLMLCSHLLMDGPMDWMLVICMEEHVGLIFVHCIDEHVILVLSPVMVGNLVDLFFV